MVALAICGSAALPSFADEDRGSDSYAIGLWGDFPYSTLQATAGVPDLIADMNAQRLAFAVHDGDLKQGSGSLCDDNLYSQALAIFDSLRAPARFTPVHQGWTVRERSSNPFASHQRLSHQRA